jgi:hypothetical protein
VWLDHLLSKELRASSQDGSALGRSRTKQACYLIFKKKAVEKQLFCFIAQNIYIYINIFYYKRAYSSGG